MDGDGRADLERAVSARLAKRRGGNKPARADAGTGSRTPAPLPETRLAWLLRDDPQARSEGLAGALADELARKAAETGRDLASLLVEGAYGNEMDPRAKLAYIEAVAKRVAGDPGGKGMVVNADKAVFIVPDNGRAKPLQADAED